MNAPPVSSIDEWKLCSSLFLAQRSPYCESPHTPYCCLFSPLCCTWFWVSHRLSLDQLVCTSSHFCDRTAKSRQSPTPSDYAWGSPFLLPCRSLKPGRTLPTHSPSTCLLVAHWWPPPFVDCRLSPQIQARISTPVPEPHPWNLLPSTFVLSASRKN